MFVFGYSKLQQKGLGVATALLHAYLCMVWHHKITDFTQFRNVVALVDLKNDFNTNNIDYVNDN